MSVWVTEEVMRWGLRFCSRSPLWQQRSFLLSASLKDRCASIHFTHIWSPRQSQMWLSSSVRSVRFYSQGANHRDGLEDGDHLAAPPAVIEFLNKGLPVKKKRSLFLDHLQICSSPSDVLDLTCKYSPTFGQVSNCLTHMWATSKKLPEEQRRHELQLVFEHPAFEQLLQKAMMSVQHMCNDDVTFSLISMVSLGVPQQSRVVQTFLRTCQEKLNYFDEKNLAILASALKNMEDSANVCALKESMSLVVETTLLRIKNVMALQTMMYLLDKDTPKDLKLKLEKKALSMADRFRLTDAHYMICTMATMGFFSKPLLDVCSKKIRENIHGIPFNRLFNLLQSCRELFYRDLHLLTSISDYVASSLDIWTHKQLLLFLSVFEKLCFCPAALMEAYAERMLANSDVLTLKDLLCVLKVYSSLNYDLQDRRQQFLDSLSHVLSSYLPKMSPFELMRAVYCLCLLGHFPYAPLEQFLQSSALETIAASKSSKNQERMLQTVDLCLRIDRPPLPRPLTVPASVLGDRTPGNPSVNVQLSQDLQSVLGERAHTMLQQGVEVEKYYFIDGVVTKPVPSQTSASEASSCAGERCSPAESSQRIAVIYAPQFGFCYGTANPRGPLAVKIRHLKILGYNPVLVTEQDLQSESEENRIHFLRGLIFPEHRTAEMRAEQEHLGS